MKFYEIEADGLVHQHEEDYPTKDMKVAFIKALAKHAVAVKEIRYVQVTEEEFKILDRQVCHKFAEGRTLYSVLMDRRSRGAVIKEDYYICVVKQLFADEFMENESRFPLYIEEK